MAEPSQIQAGTTIEWSRSIPDYDSDDGYSASYILVNESDKITISGSDITGDGTDYDVEVSNTASQAYIPGKYTWFLYASKSGEKYLVDQGQIEVLPDVTNLAGVGFDARSHIRRQLEQVEKALEAKLKDSADAASYSINTGSGSRSVSLISFEELETYRQQLKRQLRDEEAAASIAQGQGNPNKIRVRFV